MLILHSHLSRKEQHWGVPCSSVWLLLVTRPGRRLGMKMKMKIQPRSQNREDTWLSVIITYAKENNWNFMLCRVICLNTHKENRGVSSMQECIGKLPPSPLLFLYFMPQYTTFFGYVPSACENVSPEKSEEQVVGFTAMLLYIPDITLFFSTDDIWKELCTALKRYHRIIQS